MESQESVKKIVYVHGFNGNPTGGTYKALVQYFPEYEIEAQSYDLLDVEGTLNKIKAAKPDMLLGASLGGFYVLSYDDPACKKIVINPCMRPYVEIPKLDESITLDVLKKWEDTEQKTLEGLTKEAAENTFAIFAKDDELFHYKNYYDTLYGISFQIEDNSLLVQGTHHLAKTNIESFVKGVKKALEYYA